MVRGAFLGSDVKSGRLHRNKFVTAIKIVKIPYLENERGIVIVP